MARRRMIDPNIWESEDFSSLHIMERLLFIGMFSLADDEGRGRASWNYLRVKVFPYDEFLQSEMEIAINHIAEAMSVTLYTNGNKRYYQMDHWNEWQTISHPTPSKIPSPLHEDSRVAPEYSGVSPEYSRETPYDSILSEVNISENKKNISEVKVNGDSPTLQDITGYGILKNVPELVCKKFFDFNSERGWMFHGQPMKDWRTALLAWNRKEKTLSTSNYEQHEPSNLDHLLVNLDED